MAVREPGSYVPLMIVADTQEEALTAAPFAAGQLCKVESVTVEPCPDGKWLVTMRLVADDADTPHVVGGEGA